jgi:hypothetical protein
VKGKVPARHDVFSGTHFEVYGRVRMQPIKLTIDWLDTHLKGKKLESR